MQAAHTCKNTCMVGVGARPTERDGHRVIYTPSWTHESIDTDTQCGSYTLTLTGSGYTWVCRARVCAWICDGRFCR
eukprot:49032-Eustigmatos_ZCMA.PRE.1